MWKVRELLPKIKKNYKENSETAKIEKALQLEDEELNPDGKEIFESILGRAIGKGKKKGKRKKRG